MNLLAVAAMSALAPNLAIATHAFVIEGTELKSTEAVEGVNGFSLQKN
jgi:hypothetical protein